LGEVLNPAWSPDGGQIAFTAVVGGLTDLYLYDLGTDSLRRLTDDQFADLQPAWSPDGQTLAFATDRFTTDLDSLRMGPYELALMDVASGRIRRLPVFPGAKHLNPQWSPDGSAIYFLADPGHHQRVPGRALGRRGHPGHQPVHRGQRHHRDQPRAVGGPAQQPAHVQPVPGQGYEIYAIDAPVQLAGRPVVGTLPGLARRASPVRRATAILTDLLGAAGRGLPPQAEPSPPPTAPGWG
jgi:dipeptidyl aminopeptidase/acylaminoacyl peptidase